jgi:hypothetical protein
MNVEVNILAVLLAGVASMAVGMLWYSPLLFGNQWMKLMGLTKKSMEGAKDELGKIYGISFVASLVMAYVLSHVMAMSENFFGYPRMTTALTSAFWMWLGFVAPVQLTEVLYGGKKWSLYGINTGYQLMSLLAMGLVLSVF